MGSPPREAAVELGEIHGSDPTFVAKFPVDLDGTDGKFLLSSEHAKTRNVSLWISDAILLLLEHVQLFALIVSMSLSWPWPLDWIEATSIFFLANLDLWEFVKVNSVYEGQTHAFEDPSAVPFDYLGYAIAWLMAAILFPVLFYVLYAVVSRISQLGPINTLLLRARILRWFTLIAQAFFLPFGLVVVRLFGCRDYPLPEGGVQYQSVVLRDTECGSGNHVGILVPLLLVGIFYFVALPCWMVYKIRKELIIPSFCTYRTGSTHEQFVLVKEAEYVLRLDVSWAIYQYPFFSSFRRPWVWFRPLTFFTKGIILAIFGLLIYETDDQVFAMFAFVGLYWVAVMFVPVYRLHSFNAMLVFSIFVNLCNLFIGMLIVLEVQNALLVGDNLFNALLVLNVTWLFGAVVWIVYLVLRSSRVIGNRTKPIWPLLPELDRSSSFHSDHTEKFCVAILSARKVLEQCYSSTQFFAPVHELSRHVQIINAYCREAELLQDPMHPSLWALLAEMVDLHTELAPYTIYGTLTKEALPQPAVELLALIPAFRQRLDRREQEMVLWRPLKRRLLLKLFVVSTFLQLQIPKVAIRIDSGASSMRKGSRVSTLTFLQDDTEENNDDFVTGVEKWVNTRQVTLGRPRQPSSRRLGRLPRNASTNSTQSNENFIATVERWEEARRASIDQEPASRPKSLRKSCSSTGSLRSNDSFIQNVDRWVSDRRSSLTSRASNSTTSLRPPRLPVGASSAASSSNVGVRFNLDTISEMEGSISSRPSTTSSSNNDVFV